ncbi:MAG TPA: crotonase/enoyl-CoA hydratase family protein [Acidimicrobiales bacterium]
MTVEQERVGDVAVIRLDDGKANALGFDILDGLLGALDDAADANAVCIVGRPGRFSAGFDLSVMRSDRMVELMTKGSDLALRLVEHPTPVVLGVTGHALAMGAVVLMTADWRVGAAGDFKLGLNEVRIGLFVPGFAVDLADYRLSRRHLTEAVQLAEVYDPQGALAAGFLDEVVDLDAVEATAVERATAWAAVLDPGAFARTREIVRGPLLDKLKTSLGR